MISKGTGSSYKDCYIEDSWWIKIWRTTWWWRDTVRLVVVRKILWQVGLPKSLGWIRFTEAVFIMISGRMRGNERIFFLSRLKVDCSLCMGLLGPRTGGSLAKPPPGETKDSIEVRCLRPNRSNIYKMVEPEQVILTGISYHSYLYRRYLTCEAFLSHRHMGLLA